MTENLFTGTLNKNKKKKKKNPSKVFTDGDSKIFTAVHHFQGLAMDLVAVVD